MQVRRGGKSKPTANAVEASEAGDASCTPEDSVCSAEGPFQYTDGDTQTSSLHILRSQFINLLNTYATLDFLRITYYKTDKCHNNVQLFHSKFWSI